MRNPDKLTDKKKFVCCDGSGCDVCREEDAMEKLTENEEDN